MIEVPNVPNSIEVWQAFRNDWSKSVIFGQASPDTALAAASAQVNKLVAAGASP